MNLKCFFGRHKPVPDYSNWKKGYHSSVCADCGIEMRSYGGRWEVPARSSKPERSS